MLWYEATKDCKICKFYGGIDICGRYKGIAKCGRYKVYLNRNEISKWKNGCNHRITRDDSFKIFVRIERKLNKLRFMLMLLENYP